MNNKKATKRALLTSVMALAMCVVMLVGTTFAWFTDTAKTSVNKIQAGNLDVMLQVKENGEWTDAENKTLSFLQKQGENQVQNADILWEPGCTYQLPELRVINNGNLALKYKIQITGIKGDAELNRVIDWTIKNDADTDETNLANTEYHLTAKGTENDADVITIKGHMQESAGNGYMNKTIDGIAITVVATQDTVEYDSTGKDYDDFAEYPNVVTLTANDIAATSFNQPNTTYYFVGEFDAFTIDRENSTSNVAFIAADNAVFNGDVTIQYHAGDRGTALAEKSSLTVKGFHVNGILLIGSRDKNVVIEGNTAKQIKLQMHDVASDIQVLKNTFANNTDLMGVRQYGFWLDPFVTDYDLTVANNTFTNIGSHAIAVQGHAGRTHNDATAAHSITVKDNTFTSYGMDNKTGRAAFKIWEDTKLAPNNTDQINADARALAASVKDNNIFAPDPGTNCVVADFYGKTVGFN